MNLKRELNKMNSSDLKSICLELGIKYNGNKHKTIENILKPLNNKYKWSSIKGCFKCSKKNKKIELQQNKYNKLQQNKKKIELEDPELEEYWKNVKEKSKYLRPDFSNSYIIDGKRSPNLEVYSNSESPTGFSIIGNHKPVSPATVGRELFPANLRRRNSSSNFKKII